MDIPLVIEDSDSEDHAPKKKGASVATVTVTALEHPPEKNKPHHRKQLKSHQEQAATTGSDQEEEESDGATALRKVQAQEERKKCGPKNSTLNHWGEPRATVDRGSKPQWLFKCQYCNQ